MGETSAIEWTDATVNFWWGCTKVGPGCDHCYAETFDKRVGGAHWGQGVPRRHIASAAKTLAKLNRQGGKRVFIQSMSDLFDNEVPWLWFDEAWHHINKSTGCRIQIVTKRISMVEKRLAQTGIGAGMWPAHAGLMITVVNQTEADRDIPRLLALKAKLGIPWVGLSMEPLLGPVDLIGLCDGWKFIDPLRGQWWHDDDAGAVEYGRPKIDWVIVGGESGPMARPMHPDWARSLRDQCQAAGVPFFFKQWGEYGCTYDRDRDDPDWRESSHVVRVQRPGQWHNLAGGQGFHGDRVVWMRKVGKARAGRLLDGAEWNQFPGGL